MGGVLRVHGVIIVSVGGIDAFAAGDEMLAEGIMAVAVRYRSFYGEEGGGGSRSQSRVWIWVRIHLNGEIESLREGWVSSVYRL